jgi:tetratricopeptide (TPR) repeat protein
MTYGLKTRSKGIQMKSIILLTLCLFSNCLAALENTETVETFIESTAALAEGSHLRTKMTEAWKLINKGHYKKAELIADEVITSFHKLFITTKQQFAFQSDKEYWEYVKNIGTKFQRVDWAYKDALQAKAFTYASKKDFTKALDVIEKIEKIAPVSVGTKIEKAYVLGQMRDFKLAYKTYLSAISVADKYTSQLQYKPAALRGAGFILIELNRLDEAELYLKDSLELEPGNSVAINELKYINHLRK